MSKYIIYADLTNVRSTNAVLRSPRFPRMGPLQSRMYHDIPIWIHGIATESKSSRSLLVVLHPDDDLELDDGGRTEITCCGSTSLNLRIARSRSYLYTLGRESSIFRRIYALIIHFWNLIRVWCCLKNAAAIVASDRTGEVGWVARLTAWTACYRILPDLPQPDGVRLPACKNLRRLCSLSGIAAYPRGRTCFDRAL